jgi:Protein of unknown function (DUF2817)
LADGSSNSFSRNYQEARDVFRNAASRAGARLEEHVVQAGLQDHGDLAIDVAVVGASDPSWSVVVSSGLHGVEGFFGSAVQIAYLRDLLVRDSLDDLNGELVFLHALNPFGFANLRRANEDNVDLNRNFLLPGEAYRGTSDAYAELTDFLNPVGSPRHIDFFMPRALWRIGRVGLPALKQAIAEGQYDFPKGLFFGGHGPAQTTKLICSNLSRWIRGQHIVHLDLHTGLGGFAKYKLLVPSVLGTQQLQEYEKFFGSHVECMGRAEGISYKTRGDLGGFATAIARDREYHFLFVEFGTYSAIRVLSALRRENQAHFFMPEGSRARQLATAQLLECFCPASPSWRNSVLAQSLDIIRRAQQAATALAL